MRSNCARLGGAAAACTLLLSHAMADPWRVTAGADSPIVEDKNYLMFDAALLYRFGGR